jgi:hypothetical protein
MQRLKNYHQFTGLVSESIYIPSGGEETSKKYVILPLKLAIAVRTSV